MRFAHVVATRMGYGHERAAYALRHCARGEKVWLANDYEGMPEGDRRAWEVMQRSYEAVSRLKRVPLVGEGAFALMDAFQRIPEFYPRRDLSVPTFQLRQMMGVMRRREWGRHLVELLGRDRVPMISTFSAPAFAAEMFGYPEDIYLVICDSDVARGWVGLEPRKSRIKYLVPTGRVAERLQMYGVPAERITLTGFPLPPELIGGVPETVLRQTLARRLCALDAQGIFAERFAPIVDATFGARFCATLPRGARHVPHVVFAVGGAGAQEELGVTVLESLAPLLRTGALRLSLVAGLRESVARAFTAIIGKLGLSGAGTVQVLFSNDRDEYFASFAKTMEQADILWTKPSELSFYAGLGLPIIMAPTIGSQEEQNRTWLFQVGAGVDQFDPRYAHEWLVDWLHSGALARMAWNGYSNAPTHGAYRIAETIAGTRHHIRPLPLTV